MYSIKKGFDDDNRISSELVKIIPDLISIQINKDRNDQIDVPIICCKTSKEEKIIHIIRHHKIIWAILNKYCMD